MVATYFGGPANGRTVNLTTDSVLSMRGYIIVPVQTNDGLDQAVYERIGDALLYVGTNLPTLDA